MSGSKVKGSEVLTAEVCQVTPQVAVEWLKLNVKNRRLSQSRVRRYRQAIEQGEWRIAQPIMFNCDGRLIDGQTRLHAIVQAGKPVKMLVLRGFDPKDTFARIDDVSGRTLSQWLEMRGEAQPDCLATVIRYAARDRAELVPCHSSGAFVLTPAEGLEFLDAHPELRQAVGAPGVVSTLAPRAMLAFFYSKAVQLDKSLATEFLLDLGRGQEHAGDPVSALRARLLLAKRRTRRSDELKPAEMLSIFYRAWNAERTGQKVKQLQLWRPGEPWLELV
jgi:hypothetical protein